MVFIEELAEAHAEGMSIYCCRTTHYQDLLSEADLLKNLHRILSVVFLNIIEGKLTCPDTLKPWSFEQFQNSPLARFIDSL